jgi:hypothetical protein
MARPTDKGASATDDMMQGMMHGQVRMMDALLKQNIEALDFLRQRFEKDRAMLSALSATTDGAEAGKVLTEFWQKAFSDYSAEAGRLGALMTATVEQMQEGMTEEARAMMGGTGTKAKR